MLGCCLCSEAESADSSLIHNWHSCLAHRRWVVPVLSHSVVASWMQWFKPICIQNKWPLSLGRAVDLEHSKTVSWRVLMGVACSNSRNSRHSTFSVLIPGNWFYFLQVLPKWKLMSFLAMGVTWKPWASWNLTSFLMGQEQSPQLMHQVCFLKGIEEEPTGEVYQVNMSFYTTWFLNLK